MKKSRKYNLEVRAGNFLLLIIISVCGIYYSLSHERIVQQPLETVKMFGDMEMQESFHEIGSITVEISGFVANPGIYTMNAGDTVAMLVNEAGGLLAEADEKAINSLDTIFHLQEIYIGNTEKPTVSRYSKVLVSLYYPPTLKEERLISESQKVNINTADSEELVRLPGIGPKLADDIVLYRKENGDFKTIEAIMEVPKIGEKKFAALSAYITVNAEES